MPHIIAVAAHKGGVGKTVTSMALSAAFARAGQPTLLIDLDPQGHSTLGLGVDVPEGGLTVRDVLMTEVGKPTLAAVEALCPTSVALLAVLPATIALERASQWLYTRPRREAALARGLASVRHLAHWIVIDCPPSLGPLTESAVAMADLVIVPCRMEARASDGLVDLLELVSLIKGEAFDAWRILATQIDKRRSTTNAAVSAALSRWSDHQCVTEIPQSEPLNQAQIARQDIFSFDSRCAGARAYETLAAEVVALPLWRHPTVVSI